MLLIVQRVTTTLVLFSILVVGCIPVDRPALQMDDSGSELPPPAALPPENLPTPLPTRELFSPGTLVDYIAQTGDTLPALAYRFNTTVAEILEVNTFIPRDATTMPPGMPMKIPIYYRPLWGSPFQILPDSVFINGPKQVDFDAAVYVDQMPGWFKNYTFYLGDRNRRGGEIVEFIGQNYSISPRLLLAILEYQTSALSNPEPPSDIDVYPLGYTDQFSLGVARQLLWAANTLNNGYYGWRTNRLDTFNHLDGRSERPDPWQNAATVGLHYYFSKVFNKEAFEFAVSGEGFLRTYTELFGDPWENVQPHIPGSLVQPEMRLPFGGGRLWAFTGGPHTGWGEGDPLAALDFAPSNVAGGCIESPDPATAVADGIIARTGDAMVMLDLDGDGDDRTGWVVFYLHLANKSLPRTGTVLKAGDPIGMPSCEGGTSSGTHIHIARKYNGEWIPAEGTLAFNLEGWIAANGAEPYLGNLTRLGGTVRACVCSDKLSHIRAAIR